MTNVCRLSELGPAVLKILVDFLDDVDRFHPASMRDDPARGVGPRDSEISRGDGRRVVMAAGQTTLPAVSELADAAYASTVLRNPVACGRWAMSVGR